MTPEQGATPRTNTIINVHGPNHAASFGHLAGHARTLERELEALQAKADGLQSGNVRLWERAEAAERDAAALKQWWDLNPSLFQRRIEAAETRAQMLEETLKYAESELVNICNSNADRDYTDPASDDLIVQKIRKALADAPSNWLRDRLREERERCAKLAESAFSGHYDHSAKKIGSIEIAKAIRAMPEGE